MEKAPERAAYAQRFERRGHHAGRTSRNRQYRLSQGRLPPVNSDAVSGAATSMARVWGRRERKRVLRDQTCHRGCSRTVAEVFGNTALRPNRLEYQPLSKIAHVSFIEGVFGFPRLRPIHDSYAASGITM
jgi:hypothetical protein